MRRSISLPVALLALLVAVPALAGDEVAASKSLTIQTAGPRAGGSGEQYFNIEGKNNGEGGRYASFGVLTFPAKGFEGVDLKAGGLTLTLVQSVVRFSKDGKVKFFLATGDLDGAGLKFAMTGTDGLGDQVATKRPLGSAEFKKAETGKAEAIALTLDADARKELGDRVAGGKDVVLLVVPDDDDVAATYFGTGAEDAARRPRLKVTAAP